MYSTLWQVRLSWLPEEGEVVKAYVVQQSESEDLVYLEGLSVYSERLEDGIAVLVVWLSPLFLEVRKVEPLVVV
jgi:hypothetical protein